MRIAANANNLTQRITNTLGERIVTGVYSTSNQLPVEAELCAQLGASRSILREAIKMLTAKGLIMARPRLGTQVRPEQSWNLLDPDVLKWMESSTCSKDLLLEFVEARLAFEPEAAAAAAKNASVATFLAPIADAYQKMSSSLHNPENRLEAEIKFHLAILDASNNRFIRSMGPLIETALRFCSPYRDIASPMEAQLYGQLYDAISASDDEQARAASERILKNLKASIERAAI